jgi:hypothetical protein
MPHQTFREPASGRPAARHNGAEPAGSNSQRFDVERSAEELSFSHVKQAEFLIRHAGPKASKRQLIDAYSLIDPDLSDAAYRLLRLRLYHCSEACDNCWTSSEFEAALLSKSVAAIERASAQIETAGYQTSARRRNQSSVRKFIVSEEMFAAAKAQLAAYLETANVMVLETAKMRVENPEPANLQSRTRKNEGLTLVKNSIKKKDNVQIEICACDHNGLQPEEVTNGHHANPSDLLAGQKPSHLPAKAGHSGRSNAQRAMDLYNEVAARRSLPQAKGLSAARERAITARLNEIGGLDEYARTVIPNLESSAFCCGANDRGWKADFDFLCQHKSFHRLYEGTYNSATPAANAAKAGAPDESFERLIRGAEGKKPARAAEDGEVRS